MPVAFQRVWLTLRLEEGELSGRVHGLAAFRGVEATSSIDLGLDDLEPLRRQLEELLASHHDEIEERAHMAAYESAIVNERTPAGARLALGVDWKTNGGD